MPKDEARAKTDEMRERCRWSGKNQKLYLRERHEARRRFLAEETSRERERLKKSLGLGNVEGFSIAHNTGFFSRVYNPDPDYIGFPGPSSMGLFELGFFRAF